MKKLSLFIIGLYLSIGTLSAAQPKTIELKNWGLKQISAPQAWKLQEGNPNVIVAVVDTGIDADHHDLTSNLWHDINDKNTYGWNFVIDQANPLDFNGHGSHVAGIIDSLFDPEYGVSGVAHRVSIMPVKYYADAESGYANLNHGVDAINYAVAHGARIINYSGGGPEFNEDEYLAIKAAETKGVLVICAAGNESMNTDLVENYFYPASYRLSNIISVASSDRRDSLSTSSNWGRTRVDIAAPGENIYSTLPNNRFGVMSGTSQSTAFVSGAAALLLSDNPKLTPMEVRMLLMRSADRTPGLVGRVVSGGRLNIYKALVLSHKQY